MKIDLLHVLKKSVLLFSLIDVPGPIPSPCTASISGKNVVSLTWAKPSYTGGAQILAYKVESWLLAEGAMWSEVKYLGGVFNAKIPSMVQR